MTKLVRKAKVGLEIEMFVLNDEGALTNECDRIFKALQGSKLEPYLHPEVSPAMLEMGGAPKHTPQETALGFLENWELVLETAEKQGLHLLPLGTYPGKNKPVLRTGPWYDSQETVLGKETFTRAATFCGYHYHYTLPERIVREEQIRTVKKSHAKDTFLNQYNFLVAADPVALTFCQSTPFWQGEHKAKDSRVVVYRDFALKDDKSMKGMYYYLSLFGALPDYEFTVEDLRVMADKRKTEWIKLLEKKRFKRIVDVMSAPALKFMWGPLRVNKIGTFEYRGPDMNFPTYIFGLSALLSHALEAIEKQGLQTEPSDLGISKPFLLEDNTVYLPPYSRVRYLEYMTSTSGLESEEVYQYCSRMVKLVERISRKAKRSPMLKIIRQMLSERKTMSDRILELVRKNGYDPAKEVPEDVLRYVALYYARELGKDIENAQRAFAKRDSA
ncbi:MAG TPA: glutamate-cysteine ligase family protein [Candidatus Bilamarchaeaceae archaeon]|nr:glutamate-cysteine ligase family protein [Candidatus Bilamarchaeaceae archaeon]